jgi:SWI/SNF-related matrix-associated actin-dependent regulator of chromatin subfamily A-like protein 1
MLRRMKEEVLTELPPKERIVIPLEPEDLLAYKRAQAKIVESLGTSPNANRKLFDDLKYSAFGVKEKAIIAWVNEYLESGKKLVLFAYHRIVLEHLHRTFPGSVLLYGGVPSNKREELCRRFQEDPSCRLFIGQIEAAGEGLDLTAAGAVAFAEFAWRPLAHLQAEDRVYRIGQEADSVQAFYFVGIGTIDEYLMEDLDEKIKTAKLLLDGKTAESSDLLVSLTKRYRNR